MYPSLTHGFMGPRESVPPLTPSRSVQLCGGLTDVPNTQIYIQTMLFHYICSNRPRILLLRCGLKCTMSWLCTFDLVVLDLVFICNGLVCIFVFFCVSLDHFGFVFSDFILLDLVFSVPSCQEIGWEETTLK